MPLVHRFVRKLSQLFQKLLQEGLLVSFKSPTSNMHIQNPEYTITKPYNKVPLYQFLEQLDLQLLNKGIKRKFQLFLRLTISDILNCCTDQFITCNNKCTLSCCFFCFFFVKLLYLFIKAWLVLPKQMPLLILPSV